MPSACCARAASGHATEDAAAAPPSSVMKSRRFTAQYLPCFRTGGIAHRGLLRCGISSRSCRKWVKTGKAQTEHMFSGPPPTADIGERDWRVSVGPQPDFMHRNKWALLFDNLVGARE